MLNELHGEQQDSDESVWSTDISVSVETRSELSGEIVHKEYIFSYSKEWDKWTFTEYTEKRTNADSRVSKRSWRQSRHIMWYDIDESPTIDVPVEVSEKLAEATGGDVMLQVPAGTLNENRFDEV